MADFDNAFNNLQTGINSFDPGAAYQKGLTQANDAQAMKFRMSDLANQNVTNVQNFQDQQAQRTALQNNVTTDENGNKVLDQQGATNDLMSQNPVLAKTLQKSLGTTDIDLANQKMQRNKQYLAQLKSDGSNLKDIKEAALKDPAGLSAEWSNVPDYGGQNTIYSMQMGGQSLDDQIQNHLAQAKMQNELRIKALEKGYDPGPLDSSLTQPPGSSPRPGQAPGAPQGPAPVHTGANFGQLPILEHGEANDKGIKAYDDALAARKLNDPAYANAGTSLAAVKNANSIFDKYKKPDGSYDFSHLDTQEQHNLAGEAAKIIKGGGASATEEEVDAQLPKNAMSGTSNIWAKISSKPTPTNNDEFYQGMHNYFQDLKQNSIDTIQAAHNLAEQNALAQGINPKTLAIKRSASQKELQQLANGFGKSQQQYPPELLQYAKDHSLTPDQANSIISKRKAGAQ